MSGTRNCFFKRLPMIGSTGAPKILPRGDHIDFTEIYGQMARHGGGMVAHPAPVQFTQSCQRQEYVNLTNVLYSIDRDVVDPVFFPVVPDSFMNRTLQGGATAAVRPANISWNDEQDAPIVAPHDRWSF